MSTQLGKVTLYVENQADAVEFWTKKFGFVVKFEQAMGPNMKWIEVGSEDAFTTLVIYERALMEEQGSLTTQTPSLLFSTTDIKTKYEELKNNGVELEELQIMPYGSMATFYDQDGQKFILREDK